MKHCFNKPNLVLPYASGVFFLIFATLLVIFGQWQDVMTKIFLTLGFALIIHGVIRNRKLSNRYKEVRQHE